MGVVLCVQTAEVHKVLHGADGHPQHDGEAAGGPGQAGQPPQGDPAPHLHTGLAPHSPQPLLLLYLIGSAADSGSQRCPRFHLFLSSWL